MSWYNDWFNSDYYLKIYRHRDETEAERLVNFIIQNLELSPGSKVLDMACGSGRHAIIFAKKGFDVTAVDLSKLLVSEAKQNAVENNVSINFVISDILEFNPDDKFKLVMNLFTSFGYFESDAENSLVLRKACDLLKDDGYFILDYFNKNYLMKNLIPTTVFSENGSRIIQDRSIHGKRVRKKITIESKNSTKEFYESVRLYSYEEISELLTEEGLKIIGEYGDYDGNLYNIESSPRLILFAKK